MEEMILSFDNVKDRYPAEKFILLLPAVSKHIVASRPMYSLDVSTVKIDPHDKGMVYVMHEKWDSTRNQMIVTDMGLTKVALDLLCAAADVNVITERTDQTTNPLYASYRAVAFMKTAGGSNRSRTSSVEWDGELMKERIMAQAFGYVRRAVTSGWSGKAPIGVPWINLTEDQIVQVAKMRYESSWLDEREFGKRKCESKAARNAIRSLLAMKSTYPPQELEAKEFAIAKLVLTPDMEDPMIRQAVIQAGIQAQNHLYGSSIAEISGGEFTPSPPKSQPLAIPEDTQFADPHREISPKVVADPAEVVVRENIVPESTWDEASLLVPEIVSILANWPGTVKSRESLSSRFQKAFPVRDAETIMKIHSYCLDQQLANEEGGVQ
jgi:hypothetical protein